MFISRGVLCGVPAPRPLYNLPRLLASANAPVIITEGEKKADVVPTLFPGYVGTTSMGGAHAAEKSDWVSLAGRDTVVWPDNDEPGRQYAEDVAELVMRAGARSLTIVDIPNHWPEGWDLADPLPEGIEKEMLYELLRSARFSGQPAYVSFGSYRMDQRGLFWLPDDSSKEQIWLAGSFEVLAHTRDTSGYAWGKLLRWRRP